jgi:toxin FitB
MYLLDTSVISELRKNKPHGAVLAWLGQIIDSFGVLPMDGQEYRIWAQMMHGRSDAIYEDAMIAATAKTNNFTVATRNTSDFKGLGVLLVNPFKHPRQ